MAQFSVDSTPLPRRLSLRRCLLRVSFGAAWMPSGPFLPSIRACRDPADEPPAGPGWIHEIKHDGFRILAHRRGRSVRLITRNGHDLADRFPLVSNPGCAANAVRVRRSEGTAPLFGMALRRRLQEWCRSLGALPFPNAGKWLGSTPAGCEVCREACRNESSALDHGLPTSALDGDAIM